VAKQTLTSDQRKKVFGNLIREWRNKHPNKYPKELYIAFHNHWIAKEINWDTGRSGKKMNFEKMTTWDMGGRLSTFYRREQAYYDKILAQNNQITLRLEGDTLAGPTSH